MLNTHHEQMPFDENNYELCQEECIQNILCQGQLRPGDIGYTVEQYNNVNGSIGLLKINKITILSSPDQVYR